MVIVIHDVLPSSSLASRKGRGRKNRWGEIGSSSRRFPSLFLTPSSSWCSFFFSSSSGASSSLFKIFEAQVERTLECYYRNSSSGREPPFRVFIDQENGIWSRQLLISIYPSVIMNRYSTFCLSLCFIHIFFPSQFSHPFTHTAWHEIREFTFSLYSPPLMPPQKNSSQNRKATRERQVESSKRRLKELWNVAMETSGRRPLFPISTDFTHFRIPSIDLRHPDLNSTFSRSFSLSVKIDEVPYLHGFTFFPLFSTLPLLIFFWNGLFANSLIWNPHFLSIFFSRFSHHFSCPVIYFLLYDRQKGGNL